ncbi:unnamed protein product [Effrenium voratum]|uniref:Ion transport domain-containing protein n=1 Tax=Effrenium voratum TaxID=2562239 RepID=A0AA36JQJ4_9DINO|nr:unnamed protein product [Effrenium voratum]
MSGGASGSLGSLGALLQTQRSRYRVSHYGTNARSDSSLRGPARHAEKAQGGRGANWPLWSGSGVSREVGVSFILEIILRVMADGWIWFFAAGNAVDVILILVTGVVPSYILKPFFNVDSGELRIGQALRCVRLIRILKSVRTISAFRILWSLVSGIVDSGRILLWTLTIITVVLYMFSIFFVQLLVHSGLALTEEQNELVRLYFTTVPETMFTLFQCLTLDSWTGFSRILQIDQPVIGVLWLLYVAVACMVLNNLVIAVIVNNAFARAEQDEELQASIARETTEAEMNDLRILFDEIHPSEEESEEPKYLTQEDYDLAVESNHPSLWTKLKLVNLEEDEIKNLWKYLDFPPEIDKEEFASQIRALKGECKAKHSYTVAMNLKKLDARLHQARAHLETHKNICETLKKETTQVQLELSRALSEARFAAANASPATLLLTIDVTTAANMVGMTGRRSGALLPSAFLLLLGGLCTAANVNKVLQGFEDPEKVLDQALDDMQGDLIRVRQSYAEVLATQRKLQSQKQQEDRIALDWYRRAELAVEKGDDELAKEALARRQRAVNKVNDLQAQIDAMTVSVEKLFDSVKALEARIAISKEEKEELIARARTAKTTSQVNEMLSDLTSVGSTGAFERMKEKVELLENRAEDELAKLKGQKALPAGFSGIDGELEAMRKKTTAK